MGLSLASESPRRHVVIRRFAVDPKHPKEKILSARASMNFELKGSFVVREIDDKGNAVAIATEIPDRK